MTDPTDRATTIGPWALKLDGWTDEMLLMLGIKPPVVYVEEQSK